MGCYVGHSDATIPSPWERPARMTGSDGVRVRSAIHPKSTFNSLFFSSLQAFSLQLLFF